MLDELNNLELDGQCQYDVCLLLTELILTPQSSICSILRASKLFRSCCANLLPTIEKTSLLPALCTKLPTLMASGNMDVSKAAQLTMLKLLKESFLTRWNIALPAYWLTFGLVHALGLDGPESYSKIQKSRLGNLQYQLEEAKFYEPNDNVEFSKLLSELSQRHLELITLNQKNVRHMVLTSGTPSLWILATMADLFKTAPVHRKGSESF